MATLVFLNESSQDRVERQMCWTTQFQGDFIKICSIKLSPRLRSFPTGEGNGTHSSTLAWKIPWTEEPGRL